MTHCERSRLEKNQGFKRCRIVMYSMIIVVLLIVFV